MRNIRRIIAMVLTLSMVVVLVACNNSSDKGSTTKDSTAVEQAKKDYDEVVFGFVSFNNIPEDTSDVEEAINEITREKIGVEVKLMPLAISNYSQQISLAMQGGEQIDVFHSLGDFGSYVSKNQAYDITDIIDSCAPEAKEVVGERFLSTTTKDSKIYGIPAYKPIALQPQFLYRKDMMEAIGVDPSTITSIDDLDDVFAKVKEKYPDVTPLAPANQGDTGILLTIPGIDYLTDDMFYPKGVLMGDSMTVEDYYATDAFKEKAILAREWYNKGYISKDAATSSSTAIELISSGKAFSYIASYSYPPEDTAESMTGTMGGVEMGAVNIGEPFLDTNSVNSLTWMVSSTSKNPEAALKFLNLTYYDRDVLNLIIFGLEGRDYVKVDENSVKYPDGYDAATVPYTAQLSCGIVGNQFIQYVLGTYKPESIQLEMDANVNSKTSAAFGFMFDNSNVKAEYSAVMNVINQYLPGLKCGSLEPEKQIPEFIKALNDAGLDRIIEEKQTQLDAWVEQNGK